ncbi:MAG: hypothetical protein WCJ72_18080 [Chryseobacterium sp.]
MTPDLVNSSAGLIFTLFYVVVLIFIPFALGGKFLKDWKKYVKAKFFAGEKYLVFEIKIPKNNTKSPVAMELVLNALYQGGKDYEFKKEYWSGEVRPWFSLEVCSIDGTVHFYIWTKTKFRELIENQLYSQYPDIEIQSMGERDYTYNVPFDTNNYEYWGSEFKKKGASHLPIKTYTTYKLQDNPDDEFKIDPITPMMEFLGSLQKGEQVWIQICVRAHGKDKYNKEKSSYVDWVHEAQQDIKKLTKRDLKVDEKSNPGLFVLTKGEKLAVDAIEDNITKTPFDCGIRAVYIAKKDKFKKSTIGGIKNSFKQYNVTNLNSFEGVNEAEEGKWYHKLMGKAEHVAEYNKKRMYDLYRHRSFFYSEYAPYGYPFGTVPSVFSSEELATIYHFPGDVSKTPTLNRVTAKKAEAPSDLPI